MPMSWYVNDVIGTIDPTRDEDFIGFRCAR